MSAEEEIRDLIGDLASRTDDSLGGRVDLGPIRGARTDEQRLNALEIDVRKLYDAIVRLSQKID